MRFLWFLGLFFLIRIFETALFPAVFSFFVPFSLWYAVLLFALLPIRGVMISAAGIALIEFLFHVSNAFVFAFLILLAASSALAIRLFFFREGAIGNIFGIIGALCVVRVLGPAFLLFFIFPGEGGISFFTQWRAMIGWGDLAWDTLFVSFAAYFLIRRERGRRIIARAYV